VGVGASPFSAVIINPGTSCCRQRFALEFHGELRHEEQSLALRVHRLRHLSTGGAQAAGMVIVRCCCSPVCRAGSSGVWFRKCVLSCRAGGVGR